MQRRVAAFETENQAQSMKETLVHLDIYLYLFVVTSIIIFSAIISPDLHTKSSHENEKYLYNIKINNLCYLLYNLVRFALHVH